MDCMNAINQQSAQFSRIATAIEASCGSYDYPASMPHPLVLTSQPITNYVLLTTIPSSGTAHVQISTGVPR